MLIEDVAAQQPFARNTEAFYNQKITKVEVTIEGIPNQLFSQGMRAYQMWDEARKSFAASPDRKYHPDVSAVAKDWPWQTSALQNTTPASMLYGLTSGQPMMTASWQWPPQRECQRKSDNPVN